MQYKIIWLNRAVGQLESIKAYIRVEKEAPEAAQKLVETIYAMAASLSTFPTARGQVDDFHRSYRRLVVSKSFSIFYQVDEQKKVVYIANI